LSRVSSFSFHFFHKNLIERPLKIFNCFGQARDYFFADCEFNSRKIERRITNKLVSIVSNTAFVKKATREKVKMSDTPTFKEIRNEQCR